MEFYKKPYFYVLLFTLFCSLGVRFFFISVYTVSDITMEPTIKKGSRIFSLKQNLFFSKKIALEKQKLVIYQEITENKDKLSRIVALGGDSIFFNTKKVIVNGQQIYSSLLFENENEEAWKKYLIDPRMYSSSYVVPKKGERISIDSLTLREVEMLLNIIKQSHPNQNYGSKVSLFINGKKALAKDLKKYIDFKSVFGLDYNFTSLPWFSLLNMQNQLNLRFSYEEFKFKRRLFLGDSLLSHYTVSQDCFFVLDDNFKEGIDSRYFGAVCSSHIRNFPFYYY